MKTIQHLFYAIALATVVSAGLAATYAFFPPPGTVWDKTLNRWESASFLVHTNIGGAPTTNTMTANGASEGETFVALQRSPGDTGVCPTTGVPQGYDACLRVTGTGSPLTVTSFNNQFSGNYIASPGTSGVTYWSANNIGGDSAAIGITTEVPSGCNKAFGGGTYAFPPAGNECTFIDSSLQNNLGSGTGGIIAAQSITSFSYSPTQDYLVVGVTPKAYVNAANTGGTAVNVTFGDNTLAASTTTINSGSTGGISLGAKSTLSSSLLSAGTTFTASGCSNSTLVGGAIAGSYTSGTTGTCTVTITLPTAPHAWVCAPFDVTTPADTQTMTASNTTSCTISGTTVSGDVIKFMAMGY